MADMVFSNSELVKKYVKFRPSPPDELITTVVNFVKEKRPLPLQVCVDVGCGSGQSSGPYSSHFQQVFGLDVSPEQLEAAKKANLHNVVYKEGLAERLPFEDKSVDLVTSCEAAHWFDLEKFYAEVDRVLCPGGVLACYGYLGCTPTFAGRDLRQTFREIRYPAEKYLPEGHKHLLSDYTSFPDFYPEEVVVRDFCSAQKAIHIHPAGPQGKKSNIDVCLSFKDKSSERKFSVESDATLGIILGYISSWSAFSELERFEGEEAAADFLSKSKQKLLDAMGTKEENPLMKRRYDYFLRMWRKPSA